MRVDSKELIAGHPIRAVRDFLRKANRTEYFTREHVRRFFGTDITADLVKRDLIEPLTERGRKRLNLDGEAFQLTEGLGVSLSNAQMIPRINREKADRIVAEFLKRVDEVNSRDDLLYWVREVHVFGSYITTSDDLGDIDVAIRLVARGRGPGWAERNITRAEASGLSSLSHVAQLFYGEREVRQLIKARNPYLHIQWDWTAFMDQHVESKILRCDERGNQ